MLKKLRLLRYILRYLGPRWLMYRIWYYLKIKSGIMCLTAKTGKWEDYLLEDIVSHGSITSPGSYNEYRLKNSPRFFFNPDNKNSYRTRLTQWNDPSLFERIDDIARGNFHFFSHLKVHTGFPPDWHYNYSSQVRAPSDVHWSRIDDFGHGDIKLIWELSRFGFVYDLVRAYWRTNNEKYPELFWILIEDWMANNGPNLGVNWKCGQETTFRVMAWCWGLYGFLSSSHTTPQRVEMLTKMIAFSGERIEKNIGYALSQDNNHSISEVVGLWTIGILFPEFKKSKQWKRKGKKILETMVLRLFNKEGAFSQNSFNYQRLVLHDLLWAFRLGDINGENFNEEVINRFRLSVEFLYQLQEGKNGELPNYGANDGALILPLSSCDYRDFRPLLQSCFYYLNNKRVYEEGQWDEDLLWLFGPDALKTPVANKPKKNLIVPETGYYTMRSPDSLLFTRCGKHIFRPGQPDMLHADIWWKGTNIAIDPGSYGYNAPPPWDRGLGPTRYHNTVTVDNLDQMDSFGKFISFPWVTGNNTVMNHRFSDTIQYFEGTHNGYQRISDPVTYRRAILHCNTGCFIIIDKIYGTAPHTFKLHWLFKHMQYKWNDETGQLILYPDDLEYQIHYGAFNDTLETSLVVADAQTPRGWYAPYYLYKEPAISLEEIVRDSTALFYTILGSGVISVRRNLNILKVAAYEREYEIELNPRENNDPVVVHAHYIKSAQYYS